MPGVWLREVYGNRVVIERGGVREEIMISSDGDRASVARLSTPQAAPPPPSGMADDVRVASSTANDEQQGVRVFPGRNRGAFAKLGLHPGDLITAVNGSPVGGQSSVDVTALLKNGQDTDVTVWRAGRLQQITVHSGVE
jgi:general secretion pathway protein C